MITQDGKTIHLKRAFNVGVEKLFQAWSDPKLLTLWWKDLTLVEADFKTGGQFKFVWMDDPSEAAYGTFVDVQPSAKIVFSWSAKSGQGENVYNSLVTLQFTSTGPNSSRFDLIHELSPTETSVDDHHFGWTLALRDLDLYFNPASRPVKPTLEARASRTIPFPVSRVFEAWTKPEFVSLWFNGRQATRGKAGGAAKVGKALFMDYQRENGDVCRVYCGYEEITPNEKLVFSWLSEPCNSEYSVDLQHESRVTVLFTPVGGSTKVEVIHDQITSELSMKDYLAGWNDCLASVEDRLVRLECGVASVKFSPFLDIQVSDPKAAGEFYVKYFGWVRTPSQGPDDSFKFGPLNIGLSKSAANDEARKSNVHFEASIPGDLEKFKATLEAAGCTWSESSMKNAYMFHDPFGNHIHVFRV